MGSMSESPLDRVWKEYGREFASLDDLTLARWMAQSLGQLQGRVWRMSHPLIGLYRLLGQMGHDRGVWLKRLAAMPAQYSEAACCRAPLLPLFTRDILESGLICQHCGETAVAFEDLPDEVKSSAKAWAEEYAPIHEVAHWEESQRKRCANYDDEFEQAARGIERLLARASKELMPLFMESYPTMVWEDHDECLEVRPEDIEL
ncbi:MAG: hypothetical protein HYR88_12665 [Verrucomicrobia bacterium]|nr:hypothetical protein [Verrucomicrobiota bacterium]MBI3868169.1 hypothetical protein [Verrucomicrobiota bacterium]